MMMSQTNFDFQKRGASPDEEIVEGDENQDNSSSPGRTRDARV